MMMWRTILIALVVGAYLCGADTEVIQADSIDLPDGFDTDDSEEMTKLEDNTATKDVQADSIDLSDDFDTDFFEELMSLADNAANTQDDQTSSNSSDLDVAVADHAEGDDAEGDHAEGDHAEGDHAEDDHAEGDDAEGDHAEGEDAEGDHAEGDHAEGDDAEDDDAEDDDAFNVVLEKIQTVEDDGARKVLRAVNRHYVLRRTYYALLRKYNLSRRRFTLLLRKYNRSRYHGKFNALLRKCNLSRRKYRNLLRHYYALRRKYNLSRRNLSTTLRKYNYTHRRLLRLLKTHVSRRSYNILLRKYYALRRNRCRKYYNGYRYTYTTSRMTFSQAKRYCRARGGWVAYKNMASTYRRKRIYSLFPAIRRHQTWIGAYYCRPRWRYLNNHSVNRRTFGWGRGQPNYMRTQHCTETWTHPYASVNNVECKYRRAVLCEYRK